MYGRYKFFDPYILTLIYEIIAIRTTLIETKKTKTVGAYNSNV